LGPVWKGGENLPPPTGVRTTDRKLIIHTSKVLSLSLLISSSELNYLSLRINLVQILYYIYLVLMNLQRLKKNLLHIILEQGGEPILSSQYDPVLLAKDICFFPELCSPNFGCVLAAHWKAFNTNAHKYLAHYRKCLMKGKKHGTFIPHCSKYRSIRTSSLNWLLGEGQHVDVSAPGQVWSSKTAGSFICRQSALRRRQGTRYDTQAYS